MKPERLDVTSEELEALLEGVRAPLGEVSYQKLQAAIRTLSYVTELLETREATLEKLRRLLCHSSSEKTGKVLTARNTLRQGSTPRSVRLLGMGATAPRRIGERAKSRFRTDR
jgi:hypothetical protein